MRLIDVLKFFNYKKKVSSENSVKKNETKNFYEYQGGQTIVRLYWGKNGGTEIEGFYIYKMYIFSYVRWAKGQDKFIMNFNSTIQAIFSWKNIDKKFCKSSLFNLMNFNV